MASCKLASVLMPRPELHDDHGSQTRGSDRGTFEGAGGIVELARNVRGSKCTALCAQAPRTDLQKDRKADNLAKNFAGHARRTSGMVATIERPDRKLPTGISGTQRDQMPDGMPTP